MAESENTRALEGREFLQGSKSKMDLSLIYPVDPKQLPNELAVVELIAPRNKHRRFADGN
jgi:hypothetical protein